VKPFLQWTVAGCLVVGSAAYALAADIAGAGATFPYPIYATWADAYKTLTGIGLNYQSIGSGGGIQQIEAGTVTFGATDKPLGAEELDQYGLAQFPTVMGGIVPVVNLPGIEAGQLVLDGTTLADIFMGNVTSWNDPEIAALNPGVDLPSTAIAVVHRSDGSGTTFNFTYYLSDVSSEWATNIGAATAVQWPVGIGAPGNEGVAAGVGQTGGSIGYVEYAYALQNDLIYTDMINADGQRVAPTADAFAAAAANADWTGTPGFGVILANQPGAETWPMAAATFILVYKEPSDPPATLEVLKFFDWAYQNGDQMALDLEYVPMPDAVVSSIEAMWASDITDAEGQPLFMMQ
jgi:phosphate ABC transporter phosphate-binding protein